MDFAQLLRPVPRRSVFEMDGWFVWCGTMVRTPDGVCHLLFARWPRELGHSAWVTHSEIAHATSDDPLGPYTFQSVILPGAGGDAWDRDVTHNPAVLEADGRYYLYYMGNRGNGEYWNHRNNQRIGVAVSDHPAGPWERFDRPVLDVTPGSWDCLMTSNPSVCRGPDGRFLMLHKGVGAGPPPKGGAVLCGAAFADHPLGPFVKHPEPIISNPENDWAVEDPYVWWQDGLYRCLIKDFQGYFTGGYKNALALFESENGIHWAPAEQPIAMRLELEWEDGEVRRVHRLERPQLHLEGGRPRVLFCACDADLSGKALTSFNVHIPLGDG